MKRRPRKRAYALIRRKGKILIVRNRRGRSAHRELEEELGVKVDLRKRLSHDHVRRHAGRCNRCVVYRAKITKGKPKPRAEIKRFEWVTPKVARKRLRGFRRRFRDSL
jgi:8-oxo-dGTP pyrophosphatase MutT (NUDIX family)